MCRSHFHSRSLIPLIGHREVKVGFTREALKLHVGFWLTSVLPVRVTHQAGGRDNVVPLTGTHCSAQGYGISVDKVP